MMTASNLAICVGPSVLWSNDNNIMVDISYSKNVSNVAQILIEEYFNIYGDSTPYIFCEDEAGSGVGDGQEMAAASGAEDADIKAVRKTSAISNRSTGSKSKRPNMLIPF
jgi:hypothetical protein